MADTTDTQKSRRSFLGIIAGAASTAVAGVGSLMALGFLYPIPKKKPRPQFACLASTVRKDEPFIISDPAGRRVLLMRDNNNKVAAIGTVCSHLGCAVYYRPKKNIFECPCHNGFFDLQGNPISGPPRRPLDRYTVKEIEGKIFVEFG